VWTEAPDGQRQGFRQNLRIHPPRLVAGLIFGLAAARSGGEYQEIYVFRLACINALFAQAKKKIGKDLPIRCILKKSERSPLTGNGFQDEK
jgi:hypothetical protein